MKPRSVTEPARDPRLGNLGRPLPRAFYERDVVTIARALLGRVLVMDQADGAVAGRIVEVEAYRGADDPASHAWRGVTPRTRVMFGEPGHAYVYFSYGMHHCLNVVAQPAGEAAAVLIRALEPVFGIAAMEERRGHLPRHRLARGPGCVTRALGIDKANDGGDLVRGPLWISDLPPRRGGHAIVSGPRVGIRRAAERPWRFYLAGHPAVSAGPTPRKKGN